ncbi:hypothetical protein [Clostridium fungisolvens]|uniref:Uncharacterized protein n=1 Tax=Clostridium fungisolvens TaxID=1604897 RepID=A0A6V8SJE8_9CLOT|nr:hypothetical protein [Clostridium fungisolvens]GFP76645.1 hypothetical protein bsdtw1_02748 [Clostridium fungisolvens]
MGIISGIKNLFYIVKEKIKSAFVKVKNAMTHFFEKALNMMKTVVDKLASKVRGIILGASHFFRKIGNKYQEGTKNYSLEEEIGEWNETTVTREIPLEDVPPKYRTLDDEFDMDDTQELDAVLAY